MAMKKFLFIALIGLFGIVTVLIFRNLAFKKFQVTVTSNDPHVKVVSVSDKQPSSFFQEQLINTGLKSVRVEFVPENQVGFQTQPNDSATYSASSDRTIEEDKLVVKINLNIDECKLLDHKVLRGLVFQHIVYQVLSFKKAYDTKVSTKPLVELEQFKNIMGRFQSAKLFIDIQLL